MISVRIWCVKFDLSGLLFTLGCLRILIYVFYDPVWGSIRSVKMRPSDWFSVEPVQLCWGGNPSKRMSLGSEDMKCLLSDFITHSLLSFLLQVGCWELGGGVCCYLGSSLLQFVVCTCICFSANILIYMKVLSGHVYMYVYIVPQVIPLRCFRSVKHFGWVLLTIFSLFNYYYFIKQWTVIPNWGVLQ